jgi:citrate synthase
MQIGKTRTATTGICTATADSVEVRGRDLCREIMGEWSFTAYFYLLMTGRQPSPAQRYFLDLLLIAIAEHGMMPTVQAARMTLAADPNALQGALAAGLLGCGPVLLGTSELCGKMLARAEADVAAGGDADAVALRLVKEVREAGGKLPGFGHPVHRPADPRAERILELADQREVSGRHVAMARRIHGAAQIVWGKPLVMNVSMPIAAVLLDLDFPAGLIKAIPLLARSGGILAHLAEEQQNPIGFVLAGHAEQAVVYERDKDAG